MFVYTYTHMYYPVTKQSYTRNPLLGRIGDAQPIPGYSAEGGAVDRGCSGLG